MPSTPFAPLPLPPAGGALPEAFVLAPGRLYLDCAGHGPRLRAVQAAAEAALAEEALQPWTRDWPALTSGIERVRAGAALQFDGDADAVALVPSAGYGVSLAAANLPLRAGERVLVLAGQFPANLLAWQQRCADTGARLHVVEDPGGDWTVPVLDALRMDPGIRVLALPQVYWRDGRLLDLDRIADAAHATGAQLVLDLSQSLGALPVDFARWRPAFAVAAGYKWLLGADGLSFLWAAPRWREHGRPIEHGWFNRRAREDWRFPLDRPDDWLAGARRFDASGLADRQRLAKAEAALAQLARWGQPALAEQLGLRTAALRHALARCVPELAIAAPASPHLLGLRPGPAREACARALADARIDCTARAGVLRIAPHLHVGPAELEGVARVLAEALRAG